VAVGFPLEHVPEKWTRFSDRDMLQVFELARILFDQVIPPDRKARKHVPEKWTRFSDKDMLPKFLNWRILFDQVIPPDRKAR
jgi:hypothetical protein